MFLTKGAIVLGLKIREEREKRREERQGKLTIGSTEVARNAFATETRAIENGCAPTVQRTGTQPKFEGPDEVVVSPTTPGVSSPSYSEQGAIDAMSPDAETPSTLNHRSRSNSNASRPPPYSEHAFPLSTNNLSHSTTSSTSSGTTSTLLPPPVPPKDAPASRRTSTSGSGNVSILTQGSKGIQVLRVKTNGSSLASGFSYHPALFDLRVRPDEWERFTYQVVECTKLGIGDQAKMWSAATATALTGAIGTSIWVGRTMNRTLQEKKVKTAMQDMNDGGLGDTLQQWNDKYFHEKGLFAHLELSEHAMKNPEQKSKTVRMHHSLNVNREERKRKKEERKFVIVISKLDDKGVPSEAVHELAGEGTERAELDAQFSSHVAELDNTGADASRPLAMAVAGDIKRDLTEIPEGYAELPATDIAEIDSIPIEKLDLERSGVSESAETLQPPPLLVTPPGYTDKAKD